MKGLIWMADTKKVLMGFPREVQKNMGYALSLAEAGDKADYAKAMTGKELRGVIEIRDNHATDTYRVMYLAKLKHGIYVLHAFKKKSTRGVATPRHEMDTIKDRLRAAKELDKQLGKGNKEAAPKGGGNGGRKKKNE